MCQRTVEIKEQLFVLERRMKPLQWDLSKNQINEFRKQQLGRLQGEHSTLTEELSNLDK